VVEFDPQARFAHAPVARLATAALDGRPHLVPVVFALHDGVTVDQVFDAGRAELLRHRASAKSPLAQHAIDSWSERKNVPYWQVHTTNLMAGRPVGPLRQGTTINFEPIASVDGQGFFLEDMYIITKDGAELLTPGVPYSAEEIEAAMR